MAFMILEEKCIGCAACEAVCPNDAVSRGDGDIFVIDPDLCTECVGFYDEQQCAEVCPVEACVPNPGVRETHEELLAKLENPYPGKKPS